MGPELRSGPGLADGEEPRSAAVMKEKSTEAVFHAESPKEDEALQE